MAANDIDWNEEYALYPPLTEEERKKIEDQLKEEEKFVAAEQAQEDLERDFRKLERDLTPREPLYGQAASGHNALCQLRGPDADEEVREEIYVVVGFPALSRAGHNEAQDYGTRVCDSGHRFHHIELRSHKAFVYFIAEAHAIDFHANPTPNWTGIVPSVEFGNRSMLSRRGN